MAERLTIDHVGHFGDGVALAGGGSVYVPYALGGETVEVAPVPGHPDRRRLLRVEQASPERVTPFCPHFGICGGCAIQHWETERYRAWKRDLVVGMLAQAKLACEVHPLIDAHGRGRRRITLHARRGTHEVLKVGFSAANSHDIIPVDRCPILDPGLAGALDAAWAIAEPLIPTGKPLDIQITATDSGLDVDVRGSGPLSARTIATLSRVAEAHHLARLTRHGELVLMRVPPTITVGTAQVILPPGSFLQPTVAGEETLAKLVSGHCQRARNIADLFCGVGPFALRLAATSRISAFDGDAGAVAALQKAATSTPGLKPVKVETRDLFRRPLMPQELRDYDTAVFDPPRQGAQAQATQLAASKIPTVIAVSCNVTTFVRDARILIDGGYEIKGVTPVDQFRHTPHVELVARFVR
ncbi:class I SAM-dependent RNA methyltransferase [Bradyrhizobium sp.]|uniref:class I SAM-dependent RNA methyltransferase n=1 Tax=Bradyrhizobium sp. TaxID=376 RepID=UPI003C734732